MRRCAVSCSVCSCLRQFMQTVESNFPISQDLMEDRSLSFASQSISLENKTIQLLQTKTKKPLYLLSIYSITLIISLQKRSLLFPTYCLHKKKIENTIFSNIHKMFHIYIRHIINPKLLNKEE